jgi:hypothetical protein
LLVAELELQDPPELADLGGKREGQAAEGGTQTKSLLLVEDHASFRQSLASTLRLQSEVERVVQVGSLAGARKVMPISAPRSASPSSTSPCPTGPVWS